MFVFFSPTWVALQLHRHRYMVLGRAPEGNPRDSRVQESPKRAQEGPQSNQEGPGATFWFNSLVMAHNFWRPYPPSKIKPTIYRKKQSVSRACRALKACWDHMNTWVATTCWDHINTCASISLSIYTYLYIYTNNLQKRTHTYRRHKHYLRPYEYFTLKSMLRVQSMLKQPNTNTCACTCASISLSIYTHI